MRFRRGSGILLHVTSLPGRFGVGTLGPSAFRFVDFLQHSGQSFWQVLPVGPTGYGHSPYQSLSTFAGNPMLISLVRLTEDGWLDHEHLEATPKFPLQEVDFERVEKWRGELLRLAYERFSQQAAGKQAAEFREFRDTQSWWLDDYALFRALKGAHEDHAWTNWDDRVAQREPDALRLWSDRLHDEIEFHTFLQYQFERQWAALKQYAHDSGVQIIGDIPIFAAHDSADVWTNQDMFQLNERGEPTVVAGVPPDYFSETGQRWGNPLYRWDEFKRQGYDWWVRRLRRAFEIFDIVRIDHFRGFEGYWEIPADAEDARHGRWVAGPGAAFFHHMQSVLGDLPVIAEDLGVITPPVEALRDELGFPGMRVLQFAFGDDPKGPDYRPHNFVQNCVVYTGTHDNDTTVGWFRSTVGVGSTRTVKQLERERALALAYVGRKGSEIHWDMIRLAWSSVADVAITPLQDVLGLGSEARMNLPGTSIGNWKWRFLPSAITTRITERLGELSAVYGRTSTIKPWYMTS